MFDLKVTIYGCGLIGGSFALALRRSGYNGLITGGGGSRSLETALKLGVIDSIEESFSQNTICESDLIYLAAPIGGILDFLRTKSKFIKPGTLVTDAGSTKTLIVKTAMECLPDGVHFIGGHPMAGSEQNGVEHARADLFDNAPYALTIDDDTDSNKLDHLKFLIENMGARVLITNAESHDAACALISHLPQLLSSSLASLLHVERQHENFPVELAEQLAGGGWRDMTRLSNSSWSVWRDIIVTNRSNLSHSLDVLLSELTSLKHALDSNELNQIREVFVNKEKF